MLRRITDKNEEMLDMKNDSRIDDLLTRLKIEYGEGFKDCIDSSSMILLNGLDIGSNQLNGYRTFLNEGDEVTIIATPPPVAGG